MRKKVIQSSVPRLGAEPWIIEPPDVMAVFNKIRERGIPLRQFAKSRLYTGIKTGCNDAFLIKTTAERDVIIAADPSCAEIIPSVSCRRAHGPLGRRLGRDLDDRAQVKP